MKHLLFLFLLLLLYTTFTSTQIVYDTCPNSCGGHTEVNTTVNAYGIVVIYNFTENCPVHSITIPLPNCTNLYGFTQYCVLPSSQRVAAPCTVSSNFTTFFRIDINMTNPNCSSLILVWDAYLVLNKSINYVEGPIFFNYGNSTCENCTTLVPFECAPLPSNFTTGIITTSIPTTALPTTGALTTSMLTTSSLTTSIMTTSIVTTAIQTTGIRTTGVPTTSIPTTAIATTSIPTTGIPTTAIATTQTPTTAIPTTAKVTTAQISTGIIISSSVAITTGSPIQHEDKAVITFLVIGIFSLQLVTVASISIICFTCIRKFIINSFYLDD